jgi:histone demethylase JARID1
MGEQRTLEEYTELLDEGKGLNVDLPSLDVLERVVDHMKWVERAAEMSDMYLSLTDVMELLSQGSQCGMGTDNK